MAGRFVPPVLLLQGHPEMQMRFRVIRSQFECSAEVSFGFDPLVLPQQRYRVSIDSLRITGIEFESFPGAFQAFAPLTKLKKCRSHSEPSAGISWHLLNRS